MQTTLLHGASSAQSIAGWKLPSAHVQLLMALLKLPWCCLSDEDRSFIPLLTASIASTVPRQCCEENEGKVHHAPTTSFISALSQSCLGLPSQEVPAAKNLGEIVSNAEIKAVFRVSPSSCSWQPLALCK